MRTTLITSAFASVLALGVAATADAVNSDSDAGYGSGSGTEVAAPTTVPFNLESLNLTPEQMECLFASATDIDLQDMTAITDLMTQCGIDLLDVASGGPVATAPGTPTTWIGAVPAVPGDGVDPTAAAAVLAMLGVDPTAAQCIESGLLGSLTPGDDDQALVILQSCGLSLDELLSALVALNTLAGGASTVAPSVPTVPDAPTTASATVSPLVQQLIDSVQTQYGITLTPEQATCLLDNISGVDPEDVDAMLALMEQCGITLDQLGG